ncbi:IDEAL domain-containing protein [Filobacillus milosensis]|uniref:IDEAL domain-containing protein n=1 Tax=Filobacillus milosensis TaxID=94137 RepID=A0A4Y8ITD6_9BACI|nr:ReoY family proteolytic degradation factor [Filobacillus milosensis]TFB23971.1 IDEAL domain-containing protein [Filobacillus milosensis]
MSLSPGKKRIFIKWYLENFDTDKREMVWLLEYVMKRDYLLNHIHFVFEAHLCPRSIIISNNKKEKRPFRFYKDHVVTTDVDKAFHDIRLNPEETLYVEIVFDGVRQSYEYAEVLEDNPYLPEDYYLQNEDYVLLENIIDDSTRHSKINYLKNKIDQALDLGDIESFNKWSEELNNLRESKK